MVRPIKRLTKKEIEEFLNEFLGKNQYSILAISKEKHCVTVYAEYDEIPCRIYFYQDTMETADLLERYDTAWNKKFKELEHYFYVAKRFVKEQNPFSKYEV